MYNKHSIKLKLKLIKNCHTY